MQTRLWRVAASFTLGMVGLGGVAVTTQRYRRLQDDLISNPNQEPYLDFAEQERRAGKSQFSPWVTTNQHHLALAQQYFPQLPVSQTKSSGQLVNKPVEVLSLDQANRQDDRGNVLSRITRYRFYESARIKMDQPLPYQMAKTQEPLFVAVGGTSAALAAYQRAKQGKPVLYVKNEMADLDGYGELTALTDEPVKFLGMGPLDLLRKSVKTVVNPPRYTKEVLSPEFSRFNIDWAAWLKNPRHAWTGFSVLWGNYQLTTQAAKPEEEKNRPSGADLEQINTDLNILRKPKDALLVARTKQDWQAFSKAQGVLNPVSLSWEELIKKYGFYPRRSVGFMERSSASIFEPQILEKLAEGIKAQGGTVVTHWHLSRVLVDTHKNQGGILEFCETTETGEIRHHQRQFSQAHLALAETSFSPNPYPIVSVKGVTINALLMGMDLSGGPVYFGGTIVPLTAARRVDVGNKKKGDLDITDLSFVRITTGVSVGPAGVHVKEASYEGQLAINLIENVQTTLPRNARLEILSVSGSSSVLGREGRPVVIHPVVKQGLKNVPVESVTLQMGAGSGVALNASTLFSPKVPPKKVEVQTKVDESKKYLPRR